ncbi:diaminopimelate epimerase [Mesobacillus zeae]|uniref:Diaminopimelate epimerase n=1 Tax=Mesobacillus zeae TaxID=1917180 RepID=A0A398B6G9_9BACI|nr:diaminopimelate epimerase [Mesobacillus zeae]RID85535.1 diaminopimelate epimerase [Mesobacillus zeae]
MLINLIKCHGSGNDFLLIDEMEHDYGLTEESRERLARLLCDRSNELGADGILNILPSKRGDARMRVFNSDGSEASMCGNGLRCAGRYVCEKLGSQEAVIETMKADLNVKKEEDILEGIPTYRVEISPVSFKLADLPMMLGQDTLIQGKVAELSEELEFTALAVPNPHLAAIVDKKNLDSELQKKLSEAVNGPNKLFPDGVNVSFIRLLGKNRIFVRTFERGVGFTNACGTAMSASSLVTCLTAGNEFDESIEVYNPGGMVQCVVHQSGESYTVDLIGNATYVYQAEVDADLTAAAFSVKDKQNFNEQENYNKLREKAQAFLSS